MWVKLAIKTFFYLCFRGKDGGESMGYFKRIGVVSNIGYYDQRLSSFGLQAYTYKFPSSIHVFSRRKTVDLSANLFVLEGEFQN